MSCYNFCRYHKALGDVTPADVPAGSPPDLLHEPVDAIFVDYLAHATARSKLTNLRTRAL